MPSILNTPTAEIPIHFFHLPIAQREILLVNILTDPVLYERILVSALYHDDPVFPQTITLFCNYVLIARCLPTSPYHVYLYTLLRPSTPPCPLPAPPYLSCWWIEDSTGSWGLYPETTSPTFSAPFSSPSLRSSAGLTMEVSRWRRSFRSNQRAGYPNLELPTPAPLDLQDIPPPPTLYPLLTPPSTLLPNWPNKPTCSLAVLGPHLPFPPENDIVATLCQLNEAGEGLADEVLLEWALDVLCSPEDWRWLWNPEPATIPLSSPTLPSCLTPPLYNASCYSIRVGPYLFHHSLVSIDT